MKTTLSLLIFLLCLFSQHGLYAQPGSLGGPVVPYQLNRSPLFGQDIVISDQPLQNQRMAAICSAFNGWLYACFTYFNTIYNSEGFQIFKSTDSGKSWTKINDVYGLPVNQEFLSLDMVTIGDSLSNLKLFVGFVYALGSTSPGEGLVDRFNGITGDWEDGILQPHFCYSIALATDCTYPVSPSICIV
jgi:hypothetical protein